MRKTIILVLFLAIAGIAASTYLLPNKQDVALMQFHDKRFEESQAAYEKELAEGNVSVGVVRQLVDLYLQNGRIDDAILLLEEYVRRNPDNLEGRFRLGTLYQYAQRPDDYRRNLEEIVKLKPTAESLKELADIYNFNAQYDQQIETMENLVKRDAPDVAQYYSDLAYLQASQAQYNDAVISLMTLRTQYPDKMTFEHMELLTSLLMDTNQPDQAKAEATTWLATDQDPQHIARLVNIIHFKGAPKHAYELLQPYETLADTSPDLQTQRVLLYINNGRSDEAYAIMKALYAEKKLPQDLVQSFIDQALRRNDTQLVTEIVKTIDVTTLNESQLVFLVESGMGDPRTGLVETVAKQMTQEQLDRQPTLAAALALAKHEKGADQKAIALANTEGMPVNTRVQLARLCVLAKEAECAATIVAGLPADASFSDADTASIGQLYLESGQAAKGFEFVSKARLANPESKLLHPIWLKLAVANNRTEEVTTWLNNEEGKQADPKTLRDLYYLANDRHHTQLTVALAEKLYAQEKTLENRRILANAYTSSGQYAKALPLLRENRALSKADEDNYVGALTKLAKKDKAARTELAGYYEQMLKSPKLGEKRKMELVYSLIDLGRSDIAIPYVKNYAYAGGGSWGYLYTEHLKKTGQSDELLNYRLHRASAANAPEEEKRGIAFTLLEEGERSHAMNIFTQLASNKGPEHNDVKQLLYLYGPRPDETGLDWIENRARNARGAEQAAWLQHLYNASGTQRVIAFVEAEPALLNDQAVTKIYLTSLSDTGQFEKLGAVVQQRVAVTENPEQLRFLARTAKQGNQGEAAVAAYEKLLSNKPNDVEATRNLGLVAYAQANYKTARQYLAQFIQLRREQAGTNPFLNDPEGYDGEKEAYFYYAETLRRAKQTDEAQPFYQHVVDLVASEPEPTVGAQTIAAQSQYRMGATNSAYATMSHLVAENPDDKILRADYAFMLIEAKEYDLARAVLAEAKNPPASTESARVIAEIPSGMVRLHQLDSQERGLLLTFTEPVDRIRAAQALLDSKNPTISYTTAGYDQMLIMPESGYKLNVEPHDDVLIITSEQSSRYVQADLAREADLRFELLNARIDLETGDHYAAADRLEKLHETYPDDPQLLGFTANAQNYNGNWARAQELLERAHKISPQNEDISLLLSDIKKQQRGHVKVDAEWKRLGDNNEYIVGIHGFGYVRPFVRIGGSIENNYVDSDTVRRSDGRVGQYSENKQRGELFLQFDGNNGTMTKVSAFANNDTVGAGLRFGFVNPLGYTELIGEWHRPYWELTEAVLDDATRDRIGFHHTAKLRPDLTLTVAPSFNRYNVKDEDDVTQTVAVEASIRKFFFAPIPAFKDNKDLAKNLNMSLGYTIDAEYRTDEVTRKPEPGTGNPYPVFPLVSREVHMVDVTASYDFSERTNLTGYVGYAVDRLGDHGPAVGAILTHEFTDRLEGQLRASYGMSAKDSGADISRVGGYLKVGF